MDKIKKRGSIRYSLFFYLAFCMIFILAGTLFIGFGTNDLQDWYRQKHDDLAFYTDFFFVFHMGQNGEIQMEHNADHREGIHAENARYFFTFWFISNAQMILIPGWILACMFTTGAMFYRWELRKPLLFLMDASRKIEANELDFKIEYTKPNELGELCAAFDKMRSALWENNRRMWRSLEERKRLNSAFSHDLRTPLTVLRGYVDFLQEYDERISPSKRSEILSMMNGQITRLEHYTQKMSSMQKLEDITPRYRNISVEQLKNAMQDSGKILCADKKFLFEFEICPGHPDMEQTLCIDYELFIQIYENLLANACRYARSEIRVTCTETTDDLILAVRDNGQGFSKEALQKASQPFFRDEKDSQIHFGLGLYICRILCEKCNGTLLIENDMGGKVTVKIPKNNKISDS